MTRQRSDAREAALHSLSETVAIYLTHGIWFIANDAGRDPLYWTQHLLAYVAQDVLQSANAIPLLASNGLLDTARRELRFILEASIKICYVQQADPSSPILEKIQRFEDVLDSRKISVKKDLNLYLLSEVGRPWFGTEVGRLYGRGSEYTHLTSTQIRERIRVVDAGRTAGNENADDVRDVHDLVFRTLAVSLVFLLHAVPEYVAGDLLVESDGSSHDWLFARSRWIASIDAYFDYKTERQARLVEIQQTRAKNVGPDSYPPAEVPPDRERDQSG